jgi:predicted amidohydrolase
MGKSVRVGMLKAVPAKWDLDANWQVIESQWHEAGRHGLDVFMTPECFLDGYVAPEKNWTPARFDKIAQVARTSPYVARAKALCRQYECNAVIGLTEKRRGKIYNTAMLLDREGRIVGRYDKTHIPQHDVRYAPGQALPTFDLDFGRVGVVICADRRWPESVRTVCLKGAKLVLMPTYGMWHEDNEWWMRTRSYENQSWICFCHPSVSLVTDPAGAVAAKLQSTVPSVLIEDLDLSQGSDWPLEDRRPELYGVIVDTSKRTGKHSRR